MGCLVVSIVVCKAFVESEVVFASRKKNDTRLPTSNFENRHVVAGIRGSCAQIGGTTNFTKRPK